MATPKHKKSRHPGPAGEAAREAGQADRIVNVNTKFKRGQMVRAVAEPNAVGRIVAVRLATDAAGGNLVLYVGAFQMPGGSVHAWPCLENELEAVEAADAPRIVLPGTSSAELGAARAARNILTGKG